MRICVSGTSSQGKSTFVNDFIKAFPSYTTPKSTYRSFVGDNHSKNVNKDMQWRILDSMVEEIISHGKGEKVIYDRGPLDNIAHTLWANSKDIDGIDHEFVQKCLPLLQESFKFIDIVFYIPITKVAAVEYDTEAFMEDKQKGLTDENHRVEIDNILKALKFDWDVNEETKFFDPRDKPALIEIFGNEHERVEMVKLYIDADGDLIDNVGVITEDQIREMENLKADFGIEDNQSQAYQNPT